MQYIVHQINLRNIDYFGLLYTRKRQCILVKSKLHKIFQKFQSPDDIKSDIK